MKQTYKKIRAGVLLIGTLLTGFYTQAQTCIPSATITASADTICPGSNVTFIASPINGGNAPVYQWQVNGTNAGGNSDTFTTASLTDGAIVNCILTSNASCDSGRMATSSSIVIVVMPIPNSFYITASPNPVCSGNLVQLSVVATPFCGIGLPAGGNTQSAVIGSGTITQPGSSTVPPWIFENYTKSCRQQMLYTAAELSTILGGPQAINQVSFNLTAFSSNAYLTNFTVRMGCTGFDSLITWQDGLTEVLFDQNYQPINSWNNLVLNSPFYWDGVSNLVIEICNYDPNTFGNQGNKAQCTYTTLSSYIYQTGSTDLCGTDPVPVISSLRPNIRFAYAPPVFGSYTYSWQPISGAGAVSNVAISNPTAAPIQATTYHLTISDAFGCRYTDSLIVNIDTVPIIPLIVINGDSEICSGSAATFYAVDTNGGNNPHYQWQINGIAKGANSSSFIYTGFNNNDTISCTLTSSSGCASPASAISNIIVIQVDSLPSAPIVTAEEDTLISSADSGNQWYFNGYLINGAMHKMYIAQQGGIYYDSVTNNYGCGSISTGYTIDATIAVTGVACSNGYDTAIAIGMGGSSYTYLWSNGDTSAEATNLVPGQWWVTVTANTGFVSSATVNITANDFTYHLNTYQPFCAMPDSGRSTVAFTVGNGTFYYLWSNGDTTPSAINLAPGNYSVTVSDADHCFQTESFEINQYTPMGATANATSSSGNDGTAAAHGSGGTPPYSYFWNNNATDSSIHSLSPGLYTVTITDANGCSISISITVNNANGIANINDLPPSINIYPNPTDGQLTVALTGTGYHSIKLLNELGQQIYTGALNAELPEQKLQLNLSSFDNGIYLLQVITQSGNISKRVVVEK